MKKKMLTMLASAVLSVSVLCACGGDAPAADTTTTTTTDGSAATATTNGGELTFQDLQNNYSQLVDVYNKVEELYMNDSVQADEKITSVMGQAKEVIDQMGELKEEDFTSQQDMVTINDSMVSLLDSLGKIVDAMQPADSGAAATETEVTYVDGYYANDGNSDFVIAFYTTSAGDVAYVNDGQSEAYAEYTVQNATSDDFGDYLLVTVGALQLGYLTDDEGNIWITDGETLYAASQLTEEEAETLVQMTQE